jgi:hypothetical protein
MSGDSIPAPDDQHKPDTLIIKLLSCDVQRYGMEEIRMFLGNRMRLMKGTDEPTPQPPAKPRRSRPPYKSGLYAVLQAAQQHGMTHPIDGFWTMLPKVFDAISAGLRGSIAVTLAQSKPAKLTYAGLSEVRHCRRL